MHFVFFRLSIGGLSLNQTPFIFEQSNSIRSEAILA